MIDPIKSLCGLPLESFVQVVNQCCREGTRSMDNEGNPDELRRLAGIILPVSKRKVYTYRACDLMGIKIVFAYRSTERSERFDFRLGGENWVITFTGSWWSANGIIAEIGPLYVESEYVESELASNLMLMLYDFQRNGSRERFLHDMSLIRLTL